MLRSSVAASAAGCFSERFAVAWAMERSSFDSERQAYLRSAAAQRDTMRVELDDPISARVPEWSRERRPHDDASGRLAQARREIEQQRVRTVAPQAVAQAPPPRRKVRHLDAVAGEPILGHTGGEHERSVAGEFVGEH